MREPLADSLLIRSAISRRGFGIFSIVALATVQAGGSSPTPVYHLYQQALHLSPVLITVIFAAYPLSLLVSLLTIGSLSDHVGRRPMILAAMLLSALAMALFSTTTIFAGLVLARIVQGLATGAAASSLGAAILDVNPAGGSLVNSVTAFAGTTIGALLSSVLVSFAPAPTRFIYALLLLTFIALATTATRLPETSAPQPGGLRSLRPHIELPAHVRSAFWLVSPVNIAGWALGGFYLSLMPTLFKTATGVASPLLGGIVIASFALSGTIMIAVCRNVAARTILSSGAIALATGVAILLIGVRLGTIPLLAIGTLVAGIGYGASFFGAARTILPLAHLHERAGVLSAFYVESYLAFSVPAVLVALLVPYLGLLQSTYMYGGVIMVLAVASFVATRVTKPTQDMVGDR